MEPINKKYDNKFFLQSNPHWLSQKCYAIRMELGLPCLDGEVTLQSLQVEEIRRAVAAYFHMIFRGEMVKEPVHFGVQNCKQYSFIQLVATQKPDVFEAEFEFDWQGRNLTVADKPIQAYLDKAKFAIKSIEIVGVDEWESRVDEKKGYSITSPMVNVVSPVILDFPRISGVAMEKVQIEEPEIEYKEQVILYAGVGDRGDKLNILIPPYTNVMDMRNIGYDIIDLDTDISNDSIAILRRNKQSPTKLSVLDCAIVDPVREKYINWSLAVRYRLRYRKKYEFRRSSYLSTPYAWKLQKRIVSYLAELVKGLEKLPQSTVVQHNIWALSYYKFPNKMPNPWIINQSLHMLNRDWEFSIWYVAPKERWECYRPYSNWTKFLTYAIEHCLHGNYLANMFFRHKDPVISEISIACYPFNGLPPCALKAKDYYRYKVFF